MTKENHHIMITLLILTLFALMSMLSGPESNSYLNIDLNGLYSR